jgi:hypothetical protein
MIKGGSEEPPFGANYLQQIGLQELALALKIEQSTQPAPHLTLAVTADLHQNAAPPPQFNESGGVGVLMAILAKNPPH